MPPNTSSFCKGSARLRVGRYSERHRIYLVSTATAQRKAIFLSLEYGRILVRAMRNEALMGHAQTLAYVVMPDHLHWLMQLLGTQSLSKVVTRVKSGSARRINIRRNSCGQLWQKGFHDHALRREEDLISIAQYVIANPIRAGLVRSVGEYSLWDAAWI